MQTPQRPPIGNSPYLNCNRRRLTKYKRDVQERFLLTLNTSILIIDYSAHGAAQDSARRKKLGYALDERSSSCDNPDKLKESYPH